MNTTPKISVIVPVYNTEKYLHRCIDSILSQTFTDFELLLIDDGSKDSSGAICDEYAAKDNRVRVFHKENGGVSSARNLGLDNAKGDWITFVDSDDWLELLALKSMIEVADADLVIGSISFEHNSTIGTFPVLGKISGSDYFKIIAQNIDHNSICSPCVKLFKTSIIRCCSIKFDENLCFGEDSLFVKNYLLNANSLRSIDYLCYHYQDIGDDIYQKYSKSFQPIINYYNEMVEIYNRFELLKNVSISKHELIGVVFNIACICLSKNGISDLKYIRFFFNDKYVREELNRRKSLNIKILLLLSRLPKGYLLLFYAKFVNMVKCILKK